jgi:peptide/nickel transport system substrate-binding protein
MFMKRRNSVCCCCVFIKKEEVFNMKKWRRIVALALAAAMTLSLAACGGDSTTSTTSGTESTTSETSAAGTESTTETSSTVETEGTGADMTSYPRNETFYMSGNQWGAPVSANPLASNPNYGAMAQSDVARELIWETLYMYNIGDGVSYPLLADGDYVWNDDQTEITVKIKAAAKWNDGTQLTANDVAATWDAHVKYQSDLGITYSPFITSITATDDSTVVIKANTENLNRMKVLEVLPKMYIMQKAYLEELDEKNGGDATAMKNEAMWDAPMSGPYYPKEQNDQKWVIERDDEYWGQDASMWGKLPAPKYIIHNIYSSGDASALALEAGEIDMAQAYTPNVQLLWEEKDLPISTYISEAPYQAPGVLPTVVYNVQKPGLDQVAVRKAIAMATDYDKIIASAMTGQSPTFEEYPRTLFNWSDAQQDLILDKEALAPLQWTGKDTEGAIKLLDEAGIVDTNGDGNREYNGEELSFQVECPTGWTDYEAALQIVQEAGKAIGIQIETYFPEAAQYTDDTKSGNFDITLTSTQGGISAPWTVFYAYMYGFGGEFPESIPTANYGRYYNPEADELLIQLSNEMDLDKQKEIYQRLNEIYLTDVPSFAVMYRPYFFHIAYEGVWTNFPQEGDGSDPVVPAATCSDGYGVAALYNLTLVEDME